MRKYICGKNSVMDAIHNRLPLLNIYVQNKHLIKTSLPVNIKYVSKQFLDNLTSEVHQGYVAELESFNFYNLQVIKKDKPSKLLILDHIHDPHNFGAILRSCNAAGVNHVVIAKDRQADVTPTVLKVSSGGYVGIKIIKVVNLSRAIKQLKEFGFWIYASTIENSVDYRKVKFNNPYALIVGNESKGISPNILKHSDQNINIPMKGTVQSLNVSVATAIFLFKY